MTYTIAECTVNKPLMMDRRTAETCGVSCQNKFVKLVHLVGFITKKCGIVILMLSQTIIHTMSVLVNSSPCTLHGDSLETYLSTRQQKQMFFMVSVGINVLNVHRSDRNG